MATTDKSKTIGEIDTKKKEFRSEIRVCVVIIFVAVLCTVPIILNTKWMPLKSYFGLVLFVLILPFLEIFVKENLIWLFIIRTMANFSIAVMLALPAMVSYIEQTQYLLLRRLGFVILIYFIYRSTDRIRRINYEKLEVFLDKKRAIKKRKATISLWKMSYFGDLNEIIDPLTRFSFINKIVEKFYRDYLIIVSMIFLAGGAAWGIILDRTVGFKIAAYIIAIIPYHIAFYFLDKAEFQYATLRFLYKKQKKLGKKLIIV